MACGALPDTHDHVKPSGRSVWAAFHPGATCVPAHHCAAPDGINSWGETAYVYSAGWQTFINKAQVIPPLFMQNLHLLFYTERTGGRSRKQNTYRWTSH